MSNAADAHYCPRRHSHGWGKVRGAGVDCHGMRLSAVGSRTHRGPARGRNRVCPTPAAGGFHKSGSWHEACIETGRPSQAAIHGRSQDLFAVARGDGHEEESPFGCGSVMCQRLRVWESPQPHAFLPATAGGNARRSAALRPIITVPWVPPFAGPALVFGRWLSLQRPGGALGIRGETQLFGLQAVALARAIRTGLWACGKLI